VAWPAEAPSITDASPSVVKAALSRTVNLTCRAFGAPTPVITWSRGEAQSSLVQSTSDGHVRDSDLDAGQRTHFTVDDVGTLTIQVIRLYNKSGSSTVD